MNKHDHAFFVTFLRRRRGLDKLFFSEKEGKWYISIPDILIRLPPPIQFVGTLRVYGFFQS